MTGKMWVNRFMEPYKMVYRQEDIPQIKENEVLIKVKACGICGSDLVYYNGSSPLDTPDGKGPLILGHEFSGVIAEVGPMGEKIGLAVGDRVAVNPVMQCNACPACMRGEFNACSNLEVVGTMFDGAMAQYVKAKYTHVYKIPDEVPFRSAALAEPLACATHAVDRLEVGMGQTVVVYGVGGIGLMMTQLVRAAGAGKVIVVARKDYGLNKAKDECGADYVINNTDKNSPYYAEDVAARIRELNGGNLADRCILATGNMSALQDALNVTGPCTTIVYFGQAGAKDILQVPVLATLKSEKTLRFSWLSPLVWDKVFKLIASGQVNLDPVITHEFSLEDAEKGIKFMLESREPKVKGVIIVDPE